mgnify:CR=1 FL=1
MTLAIAQLTTNAPDFEAGFQRVLHWSAQTDAAIEASVAEIIADVRARGDAAVLDCTRRFDGLSADSLKALEIASENSIYFVF